MNKDDARQAEFAGDALSQAEYRLQKICHLDPTADALRLAVKGLRKQVDEYACHVLSGGK